MESGVIGNIAKGAGELAEEVGKGAAGIIGDIGEGAEHIIEGTSVFSQNIHNWV